MLDGEDLWFVRQPREAIGSPDLLELPAGKLDEDGEEPLDTARRELAEEIGKQAAEWSRSAPSTPRPASPTSRCTCSWPPASRTSTKRPAVEHDERIDAEVRPLRDLDAILAETTDSKTLIGLYRLRERLTRRTG